MKFAATYSKHHTRLTHVQEDSGYRPSQNPSVFSHEQQTHEKARNTLYGVVVSCSTF